MKAKLSIRRERRTRNGFWVTVQGPLNLQPKAAAAAESEAKRWAREERRSRVYSRTTHTDPHENGVFTHRVCFGMR